MITKIKIAVNPKAPERSRVRVTWWNDGEVEGHNTFRDIHDAALWIVEQETTKLFNGMYDRE